MKIGYIMIGAICSTMLTYGYVAFADRLEPHDAPTSGIRLVSVTSPGQTEPVPLPTPSPVPGLVAKEDPILGHLDKAKIKVNEKGLKVDIELKREKTESESQVEVERAGQAKLQLKGIEADQYVSQLLSKMGWNETMTEQQFLVALFKVLAINPVQANINIEIKVSEHPSEIKYTKVDKEDEDKDDDKDKEKKKVKVQVKVHEKHKPKEHKQKIHGEHKNKGHEDGDDDDDDEDHGDHDHDDHEHEHEDHDD
jgi:hypothetical protein